MHITDERHVIQQIMVLDSTVMFDGYTGIMGSGKNAKGFPLQDINLRNPSKYKLLSTVCSLYRTMAVTVFPSPCIQLSHNSFVRIKHNAAS